MIQTADSLTKLINQEFDDQFLNQFIAVLIAGSTHFTLVIQLNKQSYSGGSYNPYPNYNQQPTIVGKAYKVLINLEEKIRFFEFLERKNITNILVTTALEPELMNDTNKFVSNLDIIKENIQALIRIKRKDLTAFEKTLKEMTEIEVLNDEIFQKRNDLDVKHKFSDQLNTRPRSSQVALNEQGSGIDRNNVQNPQIISFYTDKSSFEIGEPISFTWETKNADNIKLMPFGKVDSEGVKTVKINQEDLLNLTVKLVATNISTGKTAINTLNILRATKRKSLEKPSSKQKTLGWNVFYALFYPILMILIFMTISFGSFYLSSIAFSFQDKFRFWLTFIFGGVMLLILYAFIKILIDRIADLKKGIYDF